MTVSGNITRQQFLKTSALAASAALLVKADLFAKAPANPGLQLYTLRSEMGKDPDGTLKKVAEIGYKEVESFGYADGKFFGKTPKDYAKFLKDLGLTTPSGHYNSGLFKGAKDTQAQSDVWKRAVDDAAVAGQKYMVWAYLFPQERTKIDDYKRHIELFNRSAEACKAGGIQFAYHNHDFEFKELDGQMPYDMILKQTDAKLVKLELDIYWATFAGKDPVALFKQDPGRYPALAREGYGENRKTGVCRSRYGFD